MFKETLQVQTEAIEDPSFEPRTRLRSAICGVGAAFPQRSFTQSEVGERLGIQTLRYKSSYKRNTSARGTSIYPNRRKDKSPSRTNRKPS